MSSSFSLFLSPHSVSVDESDNGNNWKVKVGELVWGAALGSPAWPGKVESLGPTGSLTVWVRWYGVGGTLTQVDIKSLKSLSDGLEAHHRARKRFRKWVHIPDRDALIISKKKKNEYISLKKKEKSTRTILFFFFLLY